MNGRETRPGAQAGPGQESMEATATAPRFWQRLNLVIDGTLNLIVGIALIGELCIVAWTVIGRFFHVPVLWSDEAAKFSLSTIAFVGGAAAYRQRGHPSIEVILSMLPAGAREIVFVLIDLLILTIVSVAEIVSWPLLATRWQEHTPILQLPETFIALPLTISMVAIGFSAMQRLLGRDRSAILIMVPSFLILTFMLVATRDHWGASIAVGHVPLTLTLLSFFAGIAIGVPIAFSLMIGTCVYIFASGAVPMIALSQNMVDGTGSFVLLALPFFILAGIIMERGQISSRLVQFVQSLVGHYRGGLLQAGVVSMYLMSGLSGSKAADIAAVGSILREKLRAEGYSLEQGAAVLAASAAMGETIPPSIAMLVVGSITTLSVGALFVAGIIPAAVIAVCLMVLIYTQALWIGAPRSPRVSLRAVLRTAVAAVPPMMMPLILFGGIIFGVATPTEVSAFAVVYGVMLAGLAYREFSFKSFLASTCECTLLSGMILFIVAAASSFSWVLTIAGLPQSLADLLGSTHGNQALFLFGSCILLIVIGSILEGLPALLILSPLLVPISEEVGLNPLHYGIVLVIAIGIGAFIPPIGVGFYIACAVCNSRIGPTARLMIPFAVLLVIGLFIVAYVPWFTLFLPKMVGLTTGL